MPVEEYEKVEIARRQLETALKLFFYGDDYFSVITLAGAAEEVLGRILEQAGKESSLKSIAKSSALMHKALYGEERPEKEFVFLANYARNTIKHFNSLSELRVVFDPKQEAVDMLVRATDNYFALEQRESELMERFKEYYLENEVGV